jgi:hypothetical protein
MARLVIKREGSLLTVIRDQEISDTQLLAIEEILDNERLAFNIVEDARITKLVGELYPRLEGIEQYQAESR